MNRENKPGCLHLVGVGPGDPDLITYRAVQVLETVPVIIAPKGSAGGSSSALATARAQVDLEEKEIIELHFPMKKVYAAQGRELDTEVLDAWNNAARTVLSFIDKGLDVAFPTIGDPAIYSTAYYLHATICSLRDDVQVNVIPGISAMSACSAASRQPLGLGEEIITVIPAAFNRENIREILETSETTVLMKVHRSLDLLLGLLDETGLLDNATLIERCGLPGQNIYKDPRDAAGKQLHYFSTMIVCKNRQANGDS